MILLDFWAIVALPEIIFTTVISNMFKFFQSLLIEQEVAGNR
jgi:hypothetical protein